MTYFIPKLDMEYYSNCLRRIATRTVLETKHFTALFAYKLSLTKIKEWMCLLPISDFTQGGRGRYQTSHTSSLCMKTAEGLGVKYIGFG